MLICVAAFPKNFQNLEMSSTGDEVSRKGGGGERETRIGTRGTCQSVELGRNSVN